MLFWTMVVARGQKVVYEVTISVVVVAKGVAVVLWVRVQGQLVIVRVVACANVSWEMSCGRKRYIAHRGCGVRLIALDDGGGEWAVGGVGCDNVGGGDDNWSWGTRSQAGAVVSPSIGSTGQSGHSDDSRLHCECDCLFCMKRRLDVRDSIKRLINPERVTTSDYST